MKNIIDYPVAVMLKKALSKAIKNTHGFFDGLGVDVNEKTGLIAKNWNTRSKEGSLSLDIFFADFFEILRDIVKEKVDHQNTISSVDDKHFVYCLYKKGEDKPFYVGISKHIEQRLKQHKVKKGYSKAIVIEAKNKQSAVFIEDAVIALIPSLENDTVSVFNAKELS